MNRRSDRIVLDLANRIRDEIPHVEGALPLAATDDARRGELVTAWFDTDDSEASWIASEIHRTHTEGERWSDNAVLCRIRSHFGPIVDALDALAVPYSVGSMGKLLETPEVADLLAWLRIVDNPTDEASLLRVLLGGRFRTGMTAVAAMRRWCRQNKDSALFDATLHVDEIDEITPESRERIGTFVDLHQSLVHQSQVVPVATVVDSVVNALGYWDEVAALPAGQALTAQLNINRFTELAQQWRPIEGAPSLGGFLRYLIALSESGRADELASAAPIQADAVSILTVHSAKGLEWENVYLPAIAERVFPSKAHTHDNPDSIAWLVPYELRLDSDVHTEAAAASGKQRTEILKKRHLQQEWRARLCRGHSGGPKARGQRARLGREYQECTPAIPPLDACARHTGRHHRPHGVRLGTTTGV